MQDPILTYPDQVIIFLSKNTNEMLIRKLPQIKDWFIDRFRSHNRLPKIMAQDRLPKIHGPRSLA